MSMITWQRRGKGRTELNKTKLKKNKKNRLHSEKGRRGNQSWSSAVVGFSWVGIMKTLFLPWEWGRFLMETLVLLSGNNSLPWPHAL